MNIIYIKNKSKININKKLIYIYIYIYNLINIINISKYKYI